MTQKESRATAWSGGAVHQDNAATELSHSKMLRRLRLTPEAIRGNPFLEWQEIKRVRKIEGEQHPSWKYPGGDRAFGEPPLYCCTDKYKRTLEAHLVQAIAKISREYKDMPDGTLRESNMKADVGADLWLMQSSLDEVQRGLRKAREKEKQRRLVDDSRFQEKVAGAAGNA